MPSPARSVTPSATRRLAGHLATLAPEALPASIRHEATRLLLDTVGCLVAGAASELGPVARVMGDALGGAMPCGTAAEPGALGAVYTYARLANALDYDETFPVGVHFGVGAVAAGLAIATVKHTSGRDLLTALVAGYELGGRVACQIGPMTQIEAGRVTGFAPVWGVAAPVVIAAAGTAAHLLRQDGPALEQTIGVAGANTPVPAGAHWAAAIDLPNTKYCDAGWCALTGAFAALSVEAGARGFSGFLEGSSSLARLSGAEAPSDAWLTDGLGERWMLEDITYKPWPSCRFTHQALTSLERILAETPVEASQIEAVVVETGPLAASARFTNPRPRTFASRQFSYPHMIAARLLHVPVGPAWLDPDLDQDPRFTALKERVRFEPHARGDAFAAGFTRGQMRAMPAGLRLHLADGRVLRAEADLALGDPWSPATRLSDDTLLEKFKRNVPGSAGERLAACVLALDASETVTDLVAALANALGQGA